MSGILMRDFATGGRPTYCVPSARVDECDHEATICPTPDCVQSWSVERHIYLRRTSDGLGFIDRMGLDDEVVAFLATAQPTDAASLEQMLDEPSGEAP